MNRFFVSKENINEREIYLYEEDAKHIAVLRLNVGDSVIACDGMGYDYKCSISHINKKEVVLKILSSNVCANEPDVNITLFQGLPKGDKMELIIQKAVELGVYKIIPVLTQNTVVKLKENDIKKIARWEKISLSAAKQCKRGIVPKISSVVSFEKAVEMLKFLDEAYVPYENEKENIAKNIFAQSKGKEVGIFIGPEGGFIPEEIGCLIKQGITPLSLGKRILRTETAGFVSIFTLLFMREEL